MKNKKKSIIILSIIFGILIILAVAALAPHFIKIKKDYDLLAETEYDTVMIGMFSVKNYDPEDFAFYRGMNTVITSYEIPHGKLVRMYIKKAKEFGNPLKQAYVCVDPLRTSKEDIVLMAQENPDVFFEIILPYPEISYWQDMDDAKFEEAMDLYQVFAEWIVPLENARLYSFTGEEWLICNSLHYEDSFLTTVETSEFLMCNMDDYHSYQLTKENVGDRMDECRHTIRTLKDSPGTVASLENTDIVFFGDSIIGNYTDATSIPSVVESINHAHVYNLGYGGKSAALSEKTPISFPDVVDAFLAKDVSALEDGTQVYKGLEHYLAESDESRSQVFVINYGLNDYYTGVPLTGEGINDKKSFYGAMSQGISKLKEANPDAHIILMTPNFSSAFVNGKMINGEGAGNLRAYADMITVVAEEQNVHVLDNFNELPIDEDNWNAYIPDGTHLNEVGRFLVGERITGYVDTLGIQ